MQPGKTTPRDEGLVAIFADRADLPRALERLADHGFGRGEVAVLARGAGEAAALAPLAEPLDATALDGLAERIAVAGLDELVGAATGGYLGLLGSLLLVALPGVGTFLVLAEEAALTAITAATAVAGIGLGGVLGAILEENTVERHRELYKARVAAGDWLLLVRGPDECIQTAEVVLSSFRLRHKDLFTLARPTP
jgi:hypothetical protein